MNELIARLRLAAKKNGAYQNNIYDEAADALEAQQKKIVGLERLVSSQGIRLMEAEDAESALRECIQHADAMEAEIFNLSAYDSNDAVIAYRQWRAKQ